MDIDMTRGKLMPCPFCGRVQTVGFYTDSDDLGELEDRNSFAIVCDYNEGGCGATGGYSSTKGGAIRNWNMRWPEGSRERVTENTRRAVINEFLGLAEEHFKTQEGGI